MLPQIPSVRRIVKLSIEYNPDQLPPPAEWDWDLLLANHSVLAIQQLPLDPPSAADIVNPELSAKELCTLLFPDDLSSPLSKEPFDYPIHRILVVPYSLGLRLAAQDPHREHFHFEFFPGIKPPRAEIWSRRAWLESTTRRYKAGKLRRETNSNEILLARYNQLRAEILMHLKKLSTSIKLSELGDTAEMFIKSDAMDGLFEVLQVPTALQQQIQEVRRLFQAAADQPRTNETNP